jgi:hypothetical protein
VFDQVQLEFKRVRVRHLGREAPVIILLHACDLPTEDEEFRVEPSPEALLRVVRGILSEDGS